MIGVNAVLLVATTWFFLLMVVSFWREKEFRALGIAIPGLWINGALWALFMIFNNLAWVRAMNIGLVSLLLTLLLISTVKFFPARRPVGTTGIQQFDERDHMFSRNNLKFHPTLQKGYYERHPERRAMDEKIFQQPDLGDPVQRFYDSFYSPIYEAAFSILDKSRPLSRGESNPTRRFIDSERIGRVVKQLAAFYGAVDVGITPLRAHHLYSHAGRHRDDWGREIKKTHRFAIVFVVAMDPAMIKKAPALPAILESSRQYVEAAKIADMVAEYLRIMGADARAHTDGNYQTLCVPLAVDSGLGELGRMGILIHRIYGPCVRLSVVTTDLDLIPTGKTRLYIEEFCRFCKKCARNCPSKAISSGEEPNSRGAIHWSIEQEKCFSYWKRIGTDCGFCIRVCPYTKPNTFFHRLVRFYISRNSLNQRIALLLDDLLYGRQVPVPRDNPAQLVSTFP